MGAITKIIMTKNEFLDNTSEFRQQELYVSVLCDIIIGRIEAMLFEFERTCVTLNIKNINDVKLKHLLDNSFRLLSLAKIQHNITKKWVTECIGNEDAYNVQLGVSKTITEMLSMSEDHVALMMIAVKMILAGHMPSYLQLTQANMQELAKRTNIPVEYVRLVIANIPDLMLNKNEK